MKLLKILIIAFFLVSGTSLLWAMTLPIPDFNSYIENINQAESTKIYDRTGEVLLWDLHGEVKRTVVPYENISKYVRDGFVAIEDDTFYQHKGISPTAILRAVFKDIISGSAKQGGSTITQQVVKNALLSKEKTISRKVKEWILAVKLEKELDKKQILTLYLNEIPFGGMMYGIEEASQAFFKKSASELTLPESAYLAAIPQAPSRYSPYGNHRDELEARKNLVLDKMAGLGYISKEEAQKAKKEVVEFAKPEGKGLKAPHFVFYVKDILEEKYGKDAVEKGGLKVISSLDWKLQEKAETIVAQYAADNEKNFNARNASLVAIDPKTGQILVMVGSRDYYDTSNDGNFNIALAKRQPGSSFKPIVYSTAFEKGYTPDTVLFDLPTEFNVNCDAGALRGPNRPAVICRSTTMISLWDLSAYEMLSPNRATYRRSNCFIWRG